MAEELKVINSFVEDEGRNKAAGIVKKTDGTIDAQASSQAVGAQVAATSALAKEATAGALATAYDGKYTWDQQAEAGAQPVFDRARAEAEVAAGEFAADIQKTGQDAARNVLLAKYGANQTAEKHGWTGGSLSDMDTQISYMKASISADLYGQLELQKSRIESGLAAAKYEYLAKREALSLELYKQAQDHAIAVADRTGIYIAPEVQDMTSQMRAADEVLANPGQHTPEEIDRANRVKSTITGWFTEYGISEGGVYTLSAIQTLLTEEYNDAQIEYLAAQEYQLEKDAEYIDQQMELDARTNGFITYRTEDGTMVKLDPNSTNTQERVKVRDYFNQNPDALHEIIDFKFNALKNDAANAGLTVAEYVEKNGDAINDWMSQLGYSQAQIDEARTAAGAINNNYSEAIGELDNIVNSGAEDSQVQAIGFINDTVEDFNDKIVTTGGTQTVLSKYVNYQDILGFLENAKAKITDPTNLAAINAKIEEYTTLFNDVETEYKAGFKTFSYGVVDGNVNAQAYNARYALEWADKDDNSKSDWATAFKLPDGRVQNLINKNLNVGVITNNKVTNYEIEVGAEINKYIFSSHKGEMDGMTVGEIRLIEINDRPALVIMTPDSKVRLVERADRASTDYANLLKALGYTGSGKPFIG